MLCHFCSKKLLVTSSNSFVTLSIKSQIENFLKDDKIVYNILNFRFNRQSSPDELSDIDDGQVYKELSSNQGILSSPFNFSYTFFTDGVAFGKSNKTIWPIYLTINELPYEERSKYFILAAVYVNSKDTNESYFLKPFVDEANFLSSEGISWDHEGRAVKSYHCVLWPIQLQGGKCLICRLTMLTLAVLSVTRRRNLCKEVHDLLYSKVRCICRT